MRNNEIPEEHHGYKQYPLHVKFYHMSQLFATRGAHKI